MRHIEYEIRQCADKKFSVVEFRITIQTHRHERFAIQKFNSGRETFSDRFIASSGLVLYSIDHPAYDPHYRTCIYLRGLSKYCDDSILRIPIKYFKDMADAIDEYNDNDGIYYPERI